MYAHNPTALLDEWVGSRVGYSYYPTMYAHNPTALLDEWVGSRVGYSYYPTMYAHNPTALLDEWVGSRVGAKHKLMTVVFLFLFCFIFPSNFNGCTPKLSRMLLCPFGSGNTGEYSVLELCIVPPCCRVNTANLGTEIV